MFSLKPTVATGFCLIMLCSIGNIEASADDCLPTATYNEEKGMCQCKEGYKGLGDLCCQDNKVWQTCSLGGDSQMISFKGQQFSSNYPCNKKMMKDLVIGNCRVSIESRGKIVENGTVYEDGLKLEIVPNEKENDLFERVVIFYINGSSKLEITDSENVYTGEQKNIIEKGTKSFDLTGETILMTLSNGVWTIDGCGVKVVFRPGHCMKALQVPTPGLCVSIPPTTNTKGHRGMCSFESKRSGSENANTEFMEELFAYSHGSPWNPDYNAVCFNGIAVRQICNEQKKLKSAIRKCHPLLHNSITRHCLFTNDVSGPIVVNLYHNCLLFKCMADPSVCNTEFQKSEVLQKCMPTFCDDAPENNA